MNFRAIEFQNNVLAIWQFLGMPIFSTLIFVVLLWPLISLGATGAPRLGVWSAYFVAGAELLEGALLKIEVGEDGSTAALKLDDKR